MHYTSQYFKMQFKKKSEQERNDLSKGKSHKNYVDVLEEQRTGQVWLEHNEQQAEWWKIHSYIHLLISEYDLLNRAFIGWEIGKNKQTYKQKTHN